MLKAKIMAVSLSLKREEITLRVFYLHLSSIQFALADLPSSLVWFSESGYTRDVRDQKSEAKGPQKLTCKGAEAFAFSKTALPSQAQEKRKSLSRIT